MLLVLVRRSLCMLRNRYRPKQRCSDVADYPSTKIRFGPGAFAFPNPFMVLLLAYTQIPLIITAPKFMLVLRGRR
jgi:hypothetical protein